MTENHWTAVDRYIAETLVGAVDATAIQTVGSKGYDGFAVVLVTT